jgi:hypothetical protein
VKFCEGSLSPDGFAPCILDGLFLGYDREDRQAVEPADIKASVWARSGFKEWLEIYIGLAKMRVAGSYRANVLSLISPSVLRESARHLSGLGPGFRFLLRLQINSTWRRPMPLDHHSEEPTAIRTNLGAIFVSHWNSAVQPG